jgi:hypothetical protein
MVDGNIYTFDQNGGRLIAEVETIHGIIKSGDEIYVPIEDILHLKVKRVDEARTAALVLGVILTLVAAAIIIAVSTVNPDPDL